MPEGCDEELVMHIRRARYGNLYALLRDNIGDSQGALKGSIRDL